MIIDGIILLIIVGFIVYSIKQVKKNKCCGNCSMCHKQKGIK